MARKKQTKKYTLSEFKAWLDGIEEIQPNDWHPDAAQWKMIRDKINAIVEPPPPPKQAPVRTAVQQRPVTPPQSAFTPPQSSALTQPHPNEVAAQPSVLETQDVNTNITPAAKAALAGKIPKGEATVPNMNDVSATQAIKTPNIDTMAHEYESGFS